MASFMRTYPRLRGQHWNLWPILKPDDGGDDVFFHVTALRDGDEIAKEKTVAI